MPISEKLKAAREHQGFTQVQLAKLAGVSQATISDVENGKTADVGSKILFSLADALNIDPRSLTNDEIEGSLVRPTYHEEEAMLTLYRRLPMENQRLLRGIAQTMIDLSPTRKQ